MGSHRSKKSSHEQETSVVKKDLPPFPNNKGKTRLIKAIDGKKRQLYIEDEIIIKQSNSQRKIIVFQKMRHLEQERIEFRLGYYMIGVRPKTKGRWVWGQFSLLIPELDLFVIITEAIKRGWFETQL